ncbi:MAG: AI-2E family transporter [Armatimonadetes bacterium]|nr:AI-2E family transporter [Armatimonadota bacterium]
MTGALLAALGLLFLWNVRSILPPFLIAFLVAILMDPLIRKWEAKGWPRSRSVPLLFLLLIVIVIGALSWGIPVLYKQVVDLITNAPTYIEQAQAQSNELLQSGPFRRLPLTVREPLERQISHLAERTLEWIPVALTRVSGLFGSTLSHLLWLVITLLATFYCMLDLPKIEIATLRLIPIRHRARVQALATEVTGVFSSYLRGLLIVCALYGVGVWLILKPFGIPHPLALGALAGVFYMVPYLGALVTTIIVGFVAFFSSTLAKTLAVLVVMTLLHQIFDYGITPRILGGQVGLHPLASLFAMVAGATLFGVVGIILAVPVAASLLILLRNLYPRLLRPLPSPGSLSGEPSPFSDAPPLAVDGPPEEPSAAPSPDAPLTGTENIE